MALFNLIMFPTLLVATGFALWNWRQARIERDVNLIVKASVEDLMIVTQSEIAKNKKLVEKTKNLLAQAKGRREIAEDPMDDPDMLSSVISVIVKKLGTLKLSLSDFEAVTDQDYVSVYVDTMTQDLILSLKHDLHTGGDEPMSMVNYGNPDDSTFH
jgi:flagellar motor switch/type III secretory pathway protein FliN